MEKIDNNAYEARLKDIKKPKGEEVKAQIDLSFNKLDRQRKEGLLQLKEVQKIKQRSLINQRRRLVIKYGVNHPKVQRVEAKLHFNEGFIKDINIEKDKASIKPITPSEEAWIVHGRILDENLKGITGLTIALFNETHKIIEQIKYDCTDELGYFKLVYKAKEDKQYDALFLTISKGEDRIIHRDPEPLFVKIGTIDYREIILSESDEQCTPPPKKNDEDPPKPSVEEAWIIEGRITDQYKRPWSGVMVSIYDKEEIIADKEGTTETDKQGGYHFKFEPKRSPELFEKRPNLFIKVIDQKGKNIYTSRKSMVAKVGETDEFNVTIKR